MKSRIMFSSRIFGNNVKRTLDYAVQKSFGGVEWYLNNLRLTTNEEVRERFFDELDKHQKLHYTFHLPTTDVELAHKDPFIANSSLSYLKMNVEYLSPWLTRQDYSPILTLHVGSNSISEDKLDWGTALANLAELNEFAELRNGKISLENLKSGWTIKPETHLQIIEEIGLSITFDTGHAASSPLVRSGKLMFHDYVEKLKKKIDHVHFYAYESLDTGRHMPPQNWMEVAERWDKVMNLPNLPAIVLELSTLPELERTLRLILDNTSWEVPRI